MTPLSLSALDDFISPGQVCIKPIETSVAVVEGAKRGRIDGAAVLEAPAKASITLQDCLACSGCITSAESVLINAQSVDEFVKEASNVKARGGLLIVSIAPEARASLAVHFGMDVAACHGKLVTFFEMYGADYVFDTDFAKNIHFVESRAELLDSEARHGKTLLSSDCPGWICYAEKTHSEVLPHISKVKSPQQICGILVKRLVSGQRQVPSSSIYHVTIMMCFDKKLEATRTDFVSEGTRDVDTVLTSMEVLDLIGRRQVEFAALQEGKFISQPFGVLDSPTQPMPMDASNGMQAASVLRHVAATRFGVENPPIVWKVGRNPDFREASLVIDGDTRYKVCVANGFRNIQTIIRRLKSPKGCDADYVEIMACPSGCPNGGGQIRAQDTSKAKQVLAQVVAACQQQQQQQETEKTDVARKALLDWVYGKVVGAAPGSPSARQWFHTQYHAVPPMDDNALLIKW